MSLCVRNTDHDDRNKDRSQHCDCDDVVHGFPFRLLYACIITSGSRFVNPYRGESVAYHPRDDGDDCDDEDGSHCVSLFLVVSCIRVL